MQRTHRQENCRHCVWLTCMQSPPTSRPGDTIAEWIFSTLLGVGLACTCPYSRGLQEVQLLSFRFQRNSRLVWSCSVEPLVQKSLASIPSQPGAMAPQILLRALCDVSTVDVCSPLIHKIKSRDVED